MATYGIKAKYSPFSFNELMAPLKMYKEEYDKVSENLLSLGEEAGALQQYLDPNSESGQAVQAYNDALNGLASDFSSNGLKAVSRNALYNLRRQYSGQIAKIKAATTTYQSMQDSIRKEAIKDPTLMVGYMPTVDDLVRDPSATPTTVSGNTVYKQAIQAAQSASSRIFSSEMGRKMYGYIEQMQRTGYSDAQIKNFIAGNLDAIPELREAYNNIASMYGTDTLSDPSKANDFILQGLYDGLAVSQKSNWVQDWQQKEAIEHAHAVQRARMASSGKASSGAKASGFIAGYTTPMIFKRDRDTLVKDFFDSKTGELKLSDSLFKDGKLTKPSSSVQYVTRQGQTYPTKATGYDEYNNLHEFLSKYYTEEQISNMTREDVEKTLQAVYSDASFDAQSAEQFRWKLHDAETKAIISEINNGGEARRIKSRNSDGTFVKSKGEELKHKSGEGSELRYDAATNSLILKYNDEYYEIPKSVLSTQTLQTLEEMTSLGNDGLSELRRAQLLVERGESVLGKDPYIEDVQALYQMLASKQNLTQEEKIYLNAAKEFLIGAEYLEEADGVFAGIGNEIMSYTGSRNLNTK